MNSVEEKKEENLIGNHGLNHLPLCEENFCSPAIKVEDTGSNLKTADRPVQAGNIKSKSGDTAIWIKAAGFEINSAEERECRVVSYFLPLINPQAARRENLELLVRAVKLCDQEKAASTIPAVFAHMQRLNPAFDYGWAGFPTFFDLVVSAAETTTVEVRKQNQTFILSPPQPNTSPDRKLSTKILRNYLQDLLQCRLTDASSRQNICEAASEIIFNAADSGGITLSKLSVTTAGKVSAESHSVLFAEVYNYLYALFRGHYFSFEESIFDYYNPVITGGKLPPEDWDNRFTAVQKAQFASKKSGVLFY